MLGIVIPVYKAPDLDNTIKWIQREVTVKHRIVVMEHYRDHEPSQIIGVDHIRIAREHPWPERGAGSRQGIEHLLQDPKIKVITELDVDCTDDISDINDCYNSILQDPHVIIKSRRLWTSSHDRPWIRRAITNTFGWVTGRMLSNHIRDWSYTHRYYPVSVLKQQGLPGAHLQTHMWNFALIVRLYNRGVSIKERSAHVRDYNASTITWRHLPRYCWEYTQALCEK